MPCNDARQRLPFFHYPETLGCKLDDIAEIVGRLVQQSSDMGLAPGKLGDQFVDADRLQVARNVVFALNV